jgi:four helix bundle protein
MLQSRFRELRAYQLARLLNQELHSAVPRWPWLKQQSVGVQLLRSAGSIAANIAEASGRGSRPDQRRLLYIARGSLTETEHWIDVAQELGLLELDVQDVIAELARTLNGLSRKQEGE